MSRNFIKLKLQISLVREVVSDEAERLVDTHEG